MGPKTKFPILLAKKTTTRHVEASQVVVWGGIGSSEKCKSVYLECLWVQEKYDLPCGRGFKRLQHQLLRVLCCPD